MENEQPPIDELIHAVRTGHPDAQERLLAWYRGYLKALAQRSLDSTIRSKVDSSDLVQETLLRAYEHFDEFRGETAAELSSWLRQILSSNVADAIRHFRKAARRTVTRERSLQDLITESGRFTVDPASKGEPSPEEGAEQHELSVGLTTALSRLRPDDREVVVLRSLRELSWAEVGQAMDRTPDAARVLWQRAIEHLRAAFGGES